MGSDGQERKSASSSTDLEQTPVSAAGHHVDTNKAAVRPSGAQRRYLERGLDQPGGKLPLFDRDGREVPRKTVEACLAHGWAELWIRNPIKPDWLVCRLTAAGYQVQGRAVPGQGQ